MEGILVLFFAVTSGVLPMLAYLTAIYWLDRYEREPWWMVSFAFLWGGLGGAMFGCVLNTLIVASIAALGVSESDAVGAVLVAPVVEEAAKIVPLFVLLLLRHFDNTTDGLIYGAACGLGFAMTENIYYFYSVGSATGLSEHFFHLIAIRTCFSGVVHCLASASWGFCLGFGRYRHPVLRWLVMPTLGYAAAVSIHAFWNGSVTWGALEDNHHWQTAAYVVIAGLAVGIFLLAQGSLFVEHRAIRRELADEAERGTLPGKHAEIIPYWRKRGDKGWCSPHIDQKRYLKAATRLAMRKHQASRASGLTREALERDVARYREEVRLLLRSPEASPKGWKKGKVQG